MARLIVAEAVLDSPARTRPPERGLFRVGAVQERWHPDAAEHEQAIAAGARSAAVAPEELPGGRTHSFAAALATEIGVHVHASLYERAEAEDGLGYNTAIVV